MRTTIRIDENLYRRAKSRAAQTGRTVSEVIEDAVRVALRPRPSSHAGTKALPVYGGSGLMPGVDLTTNAGLLDSMDEGAEADALR